MMRFLLFILLLAATLNFLSEKEGMAMGGNDGWYSVPRHKDAGKFEPWECTFERDNVPPVTPEADAIFQEARSLQKSLPNPKEADKIRIFNLYKQAAGMGHWKAMFNLAQCYTEGKGTPKSNTTANVIFEDMMRKGIPAGYYGKHFLVDRGMGVPRDKQKAADLLHRAAELGSPLAQYDLGEQYFFEHRGAQSMLYHTCALRQGHAASAKQIAVYLALVEENYPMAVEYYYRGGGLGNQDSLLAVSDIFEEGRYEAGIQFSFGYHTDKKLSKIFNDYFDQVYERSITNVPDIFKKHPIPVHPTISREQSRAMPSKLKDAFGGKWPDEIFPELAPDYMPPKD